MRPLNDLRGDGQHASYPKLVHTGVISLQSVAEKIHARTTFSVGEIKGLLAALAEVIAETTADGHSVRLDDIGIFRATLMLAKGHTVDSIIDSRPTAPSVCIRSISFRPSKHLIGLTQRAIMLHRIPTIAPPSVNTTPEQRLVLAHDFIKSKGFLRIADYCALTHLSRRKGRLELNTFALTDALACRGRGSHKVFVLPSS